MFVAEITIWSGILFGRKSVLVGISTLGVRSGFGQLWMQAQKES
jgi:hypothetical protein